MRIFSHRKKIFFLGGMIALLVVAGAALTSIMKKSEASAAEEEQVNLTINGKSGDSYFSIDGEMAWCVTPSLPNPIAGEHTAVVYTFDELKKGVSTGGYNITNLRRMFISYYYASLNDPNTDRVHSLKNNDGMHWALAYLYSGHDEYPSDGQYAKAIFDYYKNGFPSNLSDANVILVRDDANRQTIFTANYTVKTTYSQKLSVSKVWNDGLDAEDHNISIKFRVKDNTTNSYITLNNCADGILNKANNWTCDAVFERDSGETPHSFSIEEIITDGQDGFHVNSDQDGDYWYHEELKDGDNNPIYYIMPSNDTQGCNESDPYSVTCTMNNRSRELSSVRIWPTKRWADSGYTDYRPDGISYIIHAFVQVNGTYHEVTGLPGLPKTGFPIVKGNTYHQENTYVWGGTYVSGMATQAEYEGEMYPVIYAIEEVQNDALSAYGLICGQNLNYEGHTYCLAEDKGDGSGDYKVEWTNALEKITVTAKKHWNDGGNAAGKRPEAVAYKIFRSVNGASLEYYRTSYIMGGANAEDWSVSISLPKMDKEGNVYEYSYQEVDYYDRGTDTYTSDNYIIDGQIIGFSTADSTGIVNTAKTSIPVIKCFVDKDETKRPMSLDFELFSDKEDGAIQNLILTSANEDEDGCWRGEFDDLPVYDEDGEEITYTVTEDDSLLTDYELDEEYSICEVDAAENFAADDDDKKSCNFYNVQLIDIPVIKVWEEDSKEDRPGSIEVSLLCGDDVLDTVTLSEANNLDGDNIWEYTWKNRRIDECEQGYSVAENINIPGYATKITGNAEDGFVITNTKTLDEIMTWGSLGAGSFGIIAAGFFVVKRKLFARY